MKLIIIFILSAVNSFPQSYNSQQDPGSADWQKWGKENYSYRIPEDQQQRNYSLKNENTCGTILKSFADIYWFFISDVDGDNCSFNPTCSAFFVQAVKETNILQGTLMFADRFTRDLNLFKLNHYPSVRDGHFYDPVSLYTLNPQSIKIIQPESVVNTE